MDPEATPNFFKPRRVPFAIKEAIGRELDSMEEQGTLERVDHSEWAAPIVAVPKKDGTFRICGDYKVTVNQALAVDQYPLPKPDDLFATLAGGKSSQNLTCLKHTYSYDLMRSPRPMLPSTHTKVSIDATDFRSV